MTRGPTSPDDPDARDAPHAPHAPHAPDAPDAPHAPDAPNAPDAPDAPDAPVAPHAPDAPVAPHAPDTKAGPATTARRDASTGAPTPNTPTQPAQPTGAASKPFPKVSTGPMDLPVSSGLRKPPVTGRTAPPASGPAPAESVHERPTSREPSVYEHSTHEPPAQEPPPVREPPDPAAHVFGAPESGPVSGVPRQVTAFGVSSRPQRTSSALGSSLFTDDLGGYDEANELRDAVGVESPPPEPATESRKHKRKKARARDHGGDIDSGRGNGSEGDDHDEDGPRPRRRRTMLVVALTTFVGLAGGTLVLLGYINSGRYGIACESEQILAESGRTFPPWGMRALGGDLWKPIKIPANAECRERETEDEYELGGWYLALLVDRAGTLLTAREVTKADEAAGLLEQALLHARAPERRDQRKEIERLLGDVGYWRASAKLRDAANALNDAAKQFDTAAAQRPRHVSDASAWATYARKVAEELRAGPSDAKSSQTTQPPPSASTSSERPAAPTGVALPVEPDRAGSGSGSNTAPPTPATAPDAGVPTGGVLL